MYYAYIRVSSVKSITDNQRFEIESYAKSHDIIIDGWIEETITGTKTPDKRKLGKLLKNVKQDDTIICSELSRLGRSLYMVMDILSYCMNKGVIIKTIKDNFTLGEDIQSKVLAFAFGLSAEIERNLISQRTKEALALRKSMGVKLGRPVGAKNKNPVLAPYHDTIKVLIEKDNTYAAVARLLDVDRSTLKRYCDNNDIQRPFNSKKTQVIY